MANQTPSVRTVETTPIELEIIRRVPPHDKEAEVFAVACAMVSVSAAGILSGKRLAADDFYSGDLAVVWRAIEALLDLSKPIGLETVRAQLERMPGGLAAAGGWAELVDIAGSLPTVEHAAFYADQVQEAAHRRRLINALVRSLGMAYDLGVADPVARAQSLLLGLHRAGGEDESVHIGPIGAQVLADAMARADGTSPPELDALSTGLWDLDQELTISPTDLVIIAARPSVGKTALAIEVARHVSRTRPVLFFTLEMSKEQVVQRILSAETGVPLAAIRRARLNEADWGKLINTSGKLADRLLWINDAGAPTVSQVMAAARRLEVQGHPPALIVVDYLQLMTGDSHRDNRVLEVSGISRGLKRLARETRSAIVALSQLSRAVESRQNHRPMLSDLRDSGSLEQDADTVCFVHRDDYYAPDCERKGFADVIVAKQRNGPVGDVALIFEKSICRFRCPEFSSGPGYEDVPHAV